MFSNLQARDAVTSGIQLRFAGLYAAGSERLRMIFMAVTAAHIERISAFINARLREVQRSRASGDNDHTSRALRALRRTVGNLAARSELAAPGAHVPGQAPEAARELVLAYAWSDLRDIAQQWADHADYLVWFAAQDWELLDSDGGPATAEEPAT